MKPTPKPLGDLAGMPGPSLSEQAAQHAHNRAMQTLMSTDAYDPEKAPFRVVPDNGWYLAKRIMVTETNGIILPGTAQPIHYMILEVGHGKRNYLNGEELPMRYKRGDIVFTYGVRYQESAHFYGGYQLSYIEQDGIVGAILAPESASK